VRAHVEDGRAILLAVGVFLGHGALGTWTLSRCARRGKDARRKVDAGAEMRGGGDSAAETAARARLAASTKAMALAVTVSRSGAGDQATRER